MVTLVHSGYYRVTAPPVWPCLLEMRACGVHKQRCYFVLEKAQRQWQRWRLLQKKEKHRRYPSEASLWNIRGSNSQFFQDKFLKWTSSSWLFSCFLFVCLFFRTAVKNLSGSWFCWPLYKWLKKKNTHNFSVGGRPDFSESESRAVRLPIRVSTRLISGRWQDQRVETLGAYCVQLD